MEVEEKKEENPLSPIIYGLGRLEADSLCAACRSNDFTALFRNPEKYIPDMPGYQCTPRTVAHISQNYDNCSFCMLTYACLTGLRLEDVPNSDAFTVTSHAWTAGVSVDINDQDSGLDQNPKLLENAVTRSKERDQRYVRIVFRVCELANQNDMFYFTRRDVGGGRILIEMRERSCYNQDSHFSLQSWFDSTELDRNPPLSLTGRALADQIRFDLVRHWISCLKTGTNSVTTSFPIKLIDTVDGRLIDADTSFRYVTLSYVWGGFKQATLNNDTRIMFHNVGSITESSQNLSWTIKDAITVCKALGERFLWIDCLCIQQDDMVHKIAQIERMDDIYGHAIFTIVNAGHGYRLNADSPLSGVRPNTRKVFQFSARADSFSVMGNSCPRLQVDLEQSMWRQRAWTFQEELLSRALLIFTSSQCFLQAGKRLFCEDMIFESEQEDIALLPLTYNTTQSYHCKADADATGEFDLEDYCFIIESYVKRDLTLDEDAIRAVQGMLRRFSANLDGRNGRLIFGHPSAAFDYTLCWTAEGIYPNTRRSGFPSWSWASRKQHVEFDLGHRHHKQHNLTARGTLSTSLYTDALSDCHFTLNKRLEEEIGIDILPVKKSNADTELYYNSHCLDIAEFAEREIHFSTTCFKLHIGRYCITAEETLDSKRTEHASAYGRFIVYINQQDSTDASSTTRKTIGEIRLESEWRDSQPEELYLDFIVIRAVPGPEPFSTVEYLREQRAKGTRQEAGEPSASLDDKWVGDLRIDAARSQPDQKQTSSDQEPPKGLPPLHDHRLDEHIPKRTNKVVDHGVFTAEDWRLNLMCIEWVDVPSGAVEQNTGKQREATRKVANRIDVMRFGPRVREWLDFDPTRVDVVLA